MSHHEIILTLALAAVGLLAIWLIDPNHEACQPEIQTDERDHL